MGDEAGTTVTLYGQEKDAATSTLARMNMILHNNPIAVIEQGSTLAVPKFKDRGALKTFDYVVANPPFSDKRWSTGIDPAKDEFERFKHFGVPPPWNDCAHLPELVSQAHAHTPVGCVLADAEFDSEHNHPFVRQQLHALSDPRQTREEELAHSRRPRRDAKPFSSSEILPSRLD